ncbi:TPA: hypothetical protein ACN36G_004510 [Vibrio parahaemolyticus]|uniref:hypothetical protein n=1 Tax=Vibrio parahaemolyticus TaxID=670 RepID=UPI0004DB8235|nr:hypothetical protein [Vibrio parahaemolyticus]MDF4642656.1 hypothetical protein [Vibrio parahaemolyticus]
MLDLLKKVVLINLSAALVVIALAQFVPFFATTRLDGPRTDKVYKMVEGHDFEKDEREHYRMNYQTGLVFFIAGLPAFIACLVLQFL